MSGEVGIDGELCVNTKQQLFSEHSVVSSTNVGQNNQPFSAQSGVSKYITNDFMMNFRTKDHEERETPFWRWLMCLWETIC